MPMYTEVSQRIENDADHEERGLWAWARRKPALATVGVIGFVACGVVVAATSAAGWGAVSDAATSASSYYPDVPHTGEFCAAATDYTKVTLKSVRDVPVAALLQYDDLLGASKFETSDVIRLGEYFYAICDSSWSVFRMHVSLPTLSPLNRQVRSLALETAAGTEESGFEGIFHDASESGSGSGSGATAAIDYSSFYAVRESVRQRASDDDDDAADDGEYHAIVMRLRLAPPPGTNFSVVEACPSEFAFEGGSKGFEGATSLRGADGVLYVLGLCEGNHCAEGDRGKEAGNGVVVVMRRESTADGGDAGCVWKTVTTLPLPASAAFTDYSALTIHHSTRAVAVATQEGSEVWVGALSGGADGAFDPETAAFSEGKVYDIPRDNECHAQYCNIEGLHWLEGGGEGTPQVLVAASDKMKSKGRQDFRCMPKDQSLHLFMIP